MKTTKQENKTMPNIVNILTKDIATGIFQPRREPNPAHDEIKASIKQHGQRDPVEVILCPEELADIAGGKKYIVSRGGNTRIEILRELKIPDTLAVIGETPKDLIILHMTALDDNRARGNVSFADTGQTITNCWFEFKDKNPSAKKTNFVSEYCPGFGSTYVYLAISVGEVFANGIANKTIPPSVSKNFADLIVRYSNIVQSSIKEMKFTEPQIGGAMTQWADNLSGHIIRQQNISDDDMRDIVQAFLDERVRLMVTSSLAHAKINDLTDKISVNHGMVKQTIAIDAYMKELIDVAIEEMADRDGKLRTIVNPIDTLKAAIANHQKNKEGDKNENSTGGKTEQKRDAIISQNAPDSSPPQAAQNIGTNTAKAQPKNNGKNTVKLKPQFAVECVQDGSLSNARLINGFGLFGSNDYAQDISEALTIWKKCLPSLFAVSAKTKSQLTKEVAAKYLHAVAHARHFSHSGGLDAFFGIEKNFPVLRHALIALGFAPDSLSWDEIGIILSLLHHHNSYREHGGGLDEPIECLSITFDDKSKILPKYIGIFLWPRLSDLDNGKQKHSFFGVVDIKQPVGYAAGIFDRAKKQDCFRLATTTGKMKAPPLVASTPHGAIQNLAQGGIVPRLADNVDMSSTQITELMNAIIADEIVVNALRAVEKKVQRWQKPLTKPAAKGAK